MPRIALIYALLLLVLPCKASGPRVVVDGNPQVSGDTTFFGELYQLLSTVTSVASMETTENINLYVETTGSDTNTCTSAGSPCGTVQGALNKVPRKILHDVTINIGSGTFAGITVTAYTIGFQGSLVVQGTLGAYSPATGTASGTATGGSTSQLVDAGQAWTVNDLRGALLLVNGEYRTVKDNDATTINVVGVYSATTNGKAYSIVEQKTIFNAASSIGVYGGIEVFGAITTHNTLYFRNIKISGLTANVFIHWSGGANLERVYTSGGVYGMLIQDNTGRIYMSDCVVTGHSTYGIAFVRNWSSRSIDRNYVYNGGGFGLWVYASNFYGTYNVIEDISGTGYGLVVDGGSQIEAKYTEIDNTYYGALFQASPSVLMEPLFEVSNCGNDCIVISDVNKADFGTLNIDTSAGHGLYVAAAGFVDTDGGTIENCTDYGVFVSLDSSVRLDNNTTIQTNSAGGIYMETGASLEIDNTDGSNTGYGITLDSGATVVMSTNTGITGTTADATMNGGTTDLTWATDLAANGDVVVNVDNDTIIKRSD